MIPPITNFEHSFYKELNAEFAGRLQPHFQRKSTLISLCHILEDEVLASGISPVIFTAFQKAAYYLQEQSRYDRLQAQSRLVTVFGQDLPGGLVFEQEWFVVINEPRFKALLASYELEPADAATIEPTGPEPLSAESNRQFVGFWSYDPEIVDFATHLLAGLAGNVARKAVDQLLQEPYQAEEQFQGVGRVSSRILAHLDRTNLKVLNHVRHNQQLINELAQQTEQYNMRSGPEQLAERQILQQELVRLYSETSRSHTLLLQTTVQQARLEKAMQAGQIFLRQAQAQLGQLIPDAQAAPVLDLLNQLQQLLASPTGNS